MPNEKAEKTSDKIIDEFKEKADDSVEDARDGQTDDNPLKETVRDTSPPDANDDESGKD